MKRNGYTSVKLVLGLLALCAVPVIFWFLSLWTDRNLEYWLEYIKGVPVDVPMWMSVVVTIVLNGVIVAGNIITELFRLVL